MKKELSMRPNTRGLNAKVNLWPPDMDQNRESARLRIKGMVTHGGTRDRKMFNDAGELISILGKWNMAKYQEQEKKKKNS